MTTPHAVAPLRRYGSLADVRTSILVLVALGLAFAGMHSVLSEFGWWFGLFGVMLVVLGVAATARYFFVTWWVGSVAGIVAAIVVLSLFFTASSSIAGIIPTGATFSQVTALTNQATDSIARQSIPAIVTPGIQFLLCWIAALTAIVADAMANWWRTPALVGIPLLVIVVAPSFILPSTQDGFTFVITAIAYLGLITSGRTIRVQSTIAIPIGVVAVLGALVAPILLPTIAPGGASGSGIGVLAESINPLINLGADLRETDPTPALSYTTTATTGEYLQLTTLDNFAGKDWEPATSKIVDTHVVSEIAAPPGLAAGVQATGVSTTIQIDDTTSPWLPLPYPAVDISGLKGDWHWQSDNLTVRSSDATIQGQRYSVDSLDVEPTEQQLRAAPSDSTSPLAKVPAGLSPIVAATAKKVVGNAKTDFDKAVALQNWFRGGTFTYSTKAPVADGYDGSGISEIVPFLEKKEGYCVHFATAMAVMARTLGIPSRVAVGFLPGTATHPGNGTTTVYQVTSNNLHAWPELYFKGVGWVRFEPTPGKGFVPNFPGAPGSTSTGSDTSTSAPSTPVASHSAAPIRAPKLPGHATTTGSKALGAHAGRASGSIGGLVTLLVLLLLAIPAGIRIGIRRARLRRIRAGRDSAIETWRELRQSARDLGIDARASSTPAQLAAQLIEYLPGEDRALAALAELRALIEDDRFGIPGSKNYGVQLADDLSVVLAGLRRASAVRERFIATFVPPTLLDRMIGRALARAR